MIWITKNYFFGKISSERRDINLGRSQIERFFCYYWSLKGRFGFSRTPEKFFIAYGSSTNVIIDFFCYVSTLARQIKKEQKQQCDFNK